MYKGIMEELFRSRKMTYLVACAIMIVMPVHYRYLPPFMILLVLGWIYENHMGFKEMFRSDTKGRILFLAFLVFYLWQIVSLLYSNDLNMGWSNVFTRLSFVLFPLVLFNPGDLIKANIFKLLRIFAISTSLYIISCFVYALFRSLSFKNGIWIFNPHPPDYFWLSYFYNDEFTFKIHPSYIAMFVLLSVFIAFESFTDRSLKTISRIKWLVISVLLSASVYFISSRAAILALVVMIVFYAISRIRKSQKSRLGWIGGILVLILLLPLLSKNERVYSIFKKYPEGQTNDIRKKDDRFVVWESAIRIIKNNLLTGVGIGDVRSELAYENIRVGEDNLSKKQLNAHNQFLEVFVENGLIGFILFSGIFGFMIYIAVSEKNLLYGLFLIMMFVFFMFETILYRLAGVAFFSLFSFILLHVPNRRKIQQ
jgi:O-antigen ligase